MKTTPFALILAALFVGACASPGSPSGEAAAKSPAAVKPGCEKFSIRTQAQYDECKNSCRGDKTVREQMCNGDTNCLLANSQSTGQCMEKCEKGKASAKDASCFGD